MTKRIYVIGPVTGIEGDNLSEFMFAQNMLACEGFKVDIPHRFIRSGVPHEQAMFISIRRLVLGQDTDRRAPYAGIGLVNTVRPYYDGVALLDGWERSPGARLERQVAEACGIPCRPWREWIDERVERR